MDEPRMQNVGALAALQVWRWSLETHVFKVLADDMEHYITLPPAQQATQNFFDSAVVSASSRGQICSRRDAFLPIR